MTERTSLGLLPRSRVFFAYPVALGMAMTITIPMTFYYFREGGGKKLAFFSLIVQSAALVLSSSRIAVISLLLSSLFVYLVSRLRRFTSLLTILLVLVIVLLAIPGSLNLRNISHGILDFRKGSVIDRVKLYRYTIERILEKPAWGWGFKPREKGFFGPIGSNSTYLGVLYRTGFPGFVLLLWLWATIYWIWWRARKRVETESMGRLWSCLGTIFIAGILWQVADDLDAPPIVAFLYFAVVGMILVLGKADTQPKIVKSHI